MVAGGCNGLIGGHGGGGGIGGDDTTVACVQGAAPPTTRVRRLTKSEIQISTNAMFGIDATSALANLDAESQVNGGFSNGDGLVVSDSFANGLNLAAEAIATAFRATVTQAAYGATCYSSESAAATCAESFIRSVGRKAFRRDVTDEEVTGLNAVYTAGRETGTDGNVGDRFATGLSWIARAMVQSPDFLYLTEVGDPAVANGGKTTLTPAETAAALSFSILGMPPDDELSAAADAGQLATGDARVAQAERLIAANPDAWKRQMRQFVPQWLGINFGKPEWTKDTDALPLFTPALKDALQTETDMVIDDWAMSPDGARVDRLLTSPSTFVNAMTAPLYGVTASGSTFRKVDLEPTQRAGILTLAGFLGSTSHVAETSPVFRGKVIMQKFFCKDPPAPPPNVPPLPPVDDSAPTTTRARLQAHLSDPACSSCHNGFEPMGNAFESYDALGAFRTEQNGFPIDSSGVLVGAAGGDKPVANAIELVNLLASSPQTNECVTRQLFRFTVGRPEIPYDGCMLLDAAKEVGNGSDLKQVVLKIVRSDSFVVRTVNKQ
jgi:uncharacterized protein DUF1588/uncharacterized protein DUF1592/uncharacterized protein DUF1595/uncharacterized protein DUF1585/uncharacterized protein DUF1587